MDNGKSYSVWTCFCETKDEVAHFTTFANSLVAIPMEINGDNGVPFKTKTEECIPTKPNRSMESLYLLHWGPHFSSDRSRFQSRTGEIFESPGQFLRTHHLPKPWKSMIFLQREEFLPGKRGNQSDKDDGHVHESLRWALFKTKIKEASETIATNKKPTNSS